MYKLAYFVTPSNYSVLVFIYKLIMVLFLVE